MSISPAELVREFHESFNVAIAGEVGIPAPEVVQLRKALLFEEFKEYLSAVRDCSLVETADALADMVYVIFGTALSYGINLDSVIEEVHRSNMSKLGDNGNPILRPDGKVLKGPNYFPPRIAAVM